MEIANIIGQWISQYGFPIVACIIMFVYLNKERESHKEEIDLLSDTIAKNTQILIELKQIINMLDRRDK